MCPAAASCRYRTAACCDLSGKGMRQGASPQKSHLSVCVSLVTGRPSNLARHSGDSGIVLGLRRFGTAPVSSGPCLRGLPVLVTKAVCMYFLGYLVHRRKVQAGSASGGDGGGDDAAEGPHFRRGQAVNTRHLADKKLRGRLEHTETLAEEAASGAAAAYQWLMPAAAGGLEAEGMERTWRFSQAAIVQGAPPLPRPYPPPRRPQSPQKLPSVLDTSCPTRSQSQRRSAVAGSSHWRMLGGLPGGWS